MSNDLKLFDILKYLPNHTDLYIHIFDDNNRGVDVVSYDWHYTPYVSINQPYEENASFIINYGDYYLKSISCGDSLKRRLVLFIQERKD